MFSKIRCITFAMVIQIIAGQSIGCAYNAASFGNVLAANGLAAAETAALNANAMAYQSAIAANNLPYGPAYGPSPYPPAVYEESRVIGIPGLTYGLTLADLKASNGGGLRVSSSSPISPYGVRVESDNMAIEGPLAVSGQLPFLGVVGLEGPLAAVGQGAVAYGCGNGNIGMVSEGLEGSLANGPGLAGIGMPIGIGMPTGYGAPVNGCGGLY